MQTRKYGKAPFEVSALGLGCMRLPRIIKDDGTAEVDREKAYELIRYAADNGINYFDTAYGYHNQTSEEVLGEALEGELRKRVKIATKQPFNVMTDTAAIRRNLENTLTKLRTDYIDVYLIHNIQAPFWDEIKRRKVIEEYEKFKAEGLIRHIAFSYHGEFETFKDIMEFYPFEMCQIQQNLLDVDKEATEEAIHMAGKMGTALVIMEPLRGGGLVAPPQKVQQIYDEYPVKRSAADWAFRHLINYPEVSCVLSGMTTMEQLKENIAIFSAPDAVANCLTPAEKDILRRVKHGYESLASINCTGCEYCLPCPQGVNIPGVFSKFNEGSMFENFAQPSRSYMFMKNRKEDASQCAQCGECLAKCPQSIDIISQLQRSHESLNGWVE